MRGFPDRAGRDRGGARPPPRGAGRRGAVREDAAGRQAARGLRGPGRRRGRAGRRESGKPHRVAQWQKVYDTIVYDDDRRRGCRREDPHLQHRGLEQQLHRSCHPGRARCASRWSRRWSRILRLSPARVLEIGCGTGLLLFRIAPRCERYVATDFSDASLDYVRRHLAGVGARDGRPWSSLLKQADDFTGVEARSFDGGGPQLRGPVLPGDGLPAPGPRGRRRGDGARRLRLRGRREEPAPPGGVPHRGAGASGAAGAVHGASAAARHAAPRPRNRSWRSTPRSSRRSARHLPRIRHVHVQPKRGRHRNELSQFRYDVVLRVEGDRPPRACGWRSGWTGTRRGSASARSGNGCPGRARGTRRAGRAQRPGVGGVRVGPPPRRRRRVPGAGRRPASGVGASGGRRPGRRVGPRAASFRTRSTSAGLPRGPTAPSTCCCAGATGGPAARAPRLASPKKRSRRGPGRTTAAIRDLGR